MRHAMVLLALALGACANGDDSGLRAGILAATMNNRYRPPAPAVAPPPQPITCYRAGDVVTCY